MVRGRPMNTALPETRGLVQQRKFRAKKAEKIAELESTNRALVEENQQLKTEIQLLRDHLLNPDAVNIPRPAQKRETEQGEEIRIQMGVVQGVRDQLENALKSLRAIGGDVAEGAQASPISMRSASASTSVSAPTTVLTERTSTPITFAPAISHNYGQYNIHPEASIAPTAPSAGSSKCCKPSTTCSVSPAPRPDHQYDQSNHTQKRQRQASPNRSEWMNTSQSQRQPTAGAEFTMPARPSSSNRNFSPPILDNRGLPPINGAECCLGIVACDERGEILGWST